MMGGSHRRQWPFSILRGSKPIPAAEGVFKVFKRPPAGKALDSKKDQNAFSAGLCENKAKSEILPSPLAI